MKWLLALSITGLITAQTPLVPEGVGNLTASVLLGIITLVLVGRTIPKMFSDATQMQEKIADRHHADLERQHEDSEKLTKTLTELRVHCASKEKGG